MNKDLLCFAEGFTALKNIWIIGGQFLQDTTGYLQVLRSMHDEGRERAPLFDTFDFEVFTSTHQNPLVRINHAFTNAFSNKGYMPAMILYIIDTDLFENPELYLPSEIEGHLRWIFQTCDEAIKMRKKSMPQRSIMHGEPLLYVMKAFPRYDNGSDPNYLLFTDRLNKFNTLLQAIARCYAVGTINIQTLVGDDARWFDKKTGKKLEPSGHYRLWREVLSTLYDITRDQDRIKRRKIISDEIKAGNVKPHHSDDRRRYDNYKRY